MCRSILLSLLLSLAALPAFPSTHYWHGTVDNRFSTDENWSGGSPAGDPDADLRFANDAVRTVIYNDIPNLHFHSIVFDRFEFVLMGEPLAAEDSVIEDAGTIYCDITVSKHLHLGGGRIELYGVISGPGDVYIGSDAVFGGARSNTYAGETILGASLDLKKENGAIAVPGNIRGVPSSLGISYLVIGAPGQIPDSATVDLSAGAGELGLYADLTLHALLIGRDISGGAAAGSPVPTLTVDTLNSNGYVNVTANLRLTQRDALQVAAGKSLSIQKTLTPPAEGLTLHGGGNIGWQATFTAPVHVDGPSASFTNTNSDVELVSGKFSGSAKSITATGGTIGYSAKSAGDIRANASTRFEFLSSGDFSTIQLNGALDLGNASLFVDPATVVAGETRTLIRNASPQPVTGTFNGLPEGATLENRWRISYHGGDGNDVTISDLQHPQATIRISQDPAPQANVGQPVTITVSLTGSSGVPTGTMTLTPGGGGTPVDVAIVNGTATLTATYDRPVGGLTARYSGDANYSPGSASFGFSVYYPKPVIDSFTPTEATAGSRVMLVIKGTGFYPGSTFKTTNTVEPANVISPTEIHQVLDLSTFTNARSLSFLIYAPGFDSSSIGPSSDSKRFNVRAPATISPAMQFDSTSASATVTLGATTAWISSDATRTTTFIADDDFDSIVRWTWDRVPDAAFAVVDLNNGTFTTKASGGATMNAAAIPAHTFVYNAAGFMSGIALPVSGTNPSSTWTVLWARPHIGAWTTSITGTTVLTGSIDAMQPLGDSPQHPDVFAQGDVVIFMPRGATGANIPVFASILGNEITADAPGMVQMKDGGFFGVSGKEADKVALVPVIRTGGSAGTVSVHYRTLPRTALPNLQYTDVSGVLTFGPGETTKNIEVPLVDDMVYNGGEFDVQLFDASTTLLEPAEIRVGIEDNDPRPVLTIIGSATRTVIRGATPITVPIEFQLTGATALPVIVGWQSSVAGVYGQGSFIFMPGEHRKTLLITVPPPNGPHLIDLLRVSLTASGASGPANIINISLVPPTLVHVRASDVTVDEKAGSATVTLTFVPPVPPGEYVTFDYETADGSATAGSDYTSVHGWLTLTTAQPQQTIDIPIIDDATVEGDESFTLKLTREPGYDEFFEEPNVPIVIADDEVTGRPSLSIVSQASVVESDDLAAALVDVHLSAASTRPVRVHYVTHDGSAIGGIDYQSIDDVLTFAPGETVKTISIPVVGDGLLESNETFTIALSAAENATIGVAQSTVTITDDDQPIPRRRAGGH